MLSAIHIVNVPDSRLTSTLSFRINVRKIKLHLSLKLTVIVVFYICLLKAFWSLEMLC